MSTPLHNLIVSNNSGVNSTSKDIASADKAANTIVIGTSTDPSLILFSEGDGSEDIAQRRAKKLKYQTEKGTERTESRYGDTSTLKGGSEQVALLNHQQMKRQDLASMNQDSSIEEEKDESPHNLTAEERSRDGSFEILQASSQFDKSRRHTSALGTQKQGRPKNSSNIGSRQKELLGLQMLKENKEELMSRGALSNNHESRPQISVADDKSGHSYTSLNRDSFNIK